MFFFLQYFVCRKEICAQNSNSTWSERDRDFPSSSFSTSIFTRLRLYINEAFAYHAIRIRFAFFPVQISWTSKKDVSPVETSLRARSTGIRFAKVFIEMSNGFLFFRYRKRFWLINQREKNNSTLLIKVYYIFHLISVVGFVTARRVE